MEEVPSETCWDTRVREEIFMTESVDSFWAENMPGRGALGSSPGSVVDDCVILNRLLEISAMCFRE